MVSKNCSKLMKKVAADKGRSSEGIVRSIKGAETLPGIITDPGFKKQLGATAKRIGDITGYAKPVNPFDKYKRMARRVYDNPELLVTGARRLFDDNRARLTDYQQKLQKSFGGFLDDYYKGDTRKSSIDFFEDYGANRLMPTLRGIADAANTYGPSFSRYFDPFYKDNANRIKGIAGDAGSVVGKTLRRGKELFRGFTPNVSPETMNAVGETWGSFKRGLGLGYDGK